MKKIYAQVNTDQNIVNHHPMLKLEATMQFTQVRIF